MKAQVIICIILFSFLPGYSQKIQAIVPAQVVAGNAFQLQYIINDPATLVNISSPQFENLQLVSGPNYYKGTSVVNGKEKQIENITFTVVPLKPGKVKIHAVTARFKNNEEQTSDELVLTVVPQPKASFNTTSTYTDINLYAPSSKTDRDKLIDDNLFIKAEVDKHVCFLGEAITATFKLYSRLQSTSEVINAPSLYGFSVMDILDINEAHQAVETIGGKIFNTSILRKLQLYPAQTGKLSIDPMQLQNTIEFNDSLTGKKLHVDKLLASQPVEIEVRALPSKEPANYTGAVGQFNISTFVPRSMIAANSQGKLIVTLAGAGNFLQFGPPVITWPKGFEVFDPVVSDEIDKEVVPTQGKRAYKFSFTTDQPGHYSIAPITFSYFDPHSGHYNQLTTDSLILTITAAKANSLTKYGRAVLRSGKSLWGYLLLAIVLITAGLLLWRRSKSKNDQSKPLRGESDYLEKLHSLQSLPARDFYSGLHKLLDLVAKENSLTPQQSEQLREIQQECQLFIYSQADEDNVRGQLQKKTEDLLKGIGS